jgi:hypothetical protein
MPSSSSACLFPTAAIFAPRAPFYNLVSFRSVHCVDDGNANGIGAMRRVKGVRLCITIV